ncbi:MAG: hypothetical protein LBU16_03535, partial [Treponema sp.]|nr:hypothetical protein [Treponema sp.]
MNKFRVLAGILFFCAALGWGDIFTWAGGSSGYWNNPANWAPPNPNRFPGYNLSGAGSPVNGDIAVFNGPATVTLYSLSSGMDVTIQLDPGASSVTLKNALPGGTNLGSFSLQAQDGSGPVWLTVAGTLTFDDEFKAIITRTTKSLSIASDGNFTLAGAGINSEGPVTITAAGAITIKGPIASTGTGSSIAISAAGAIDANDASAAICSTDGTITLTADDIELYTASSQPATVDAGSGLVRILNKTKDAKIVLGGTGTGVISLSAAEIDHISAHALEIGDKATSGDITINGDVTFPIIKINTKSSIAQISGTITAATLEIDAAGIVDVDDSAHAVTALKVINSAGMQFKNTGALGITQITSSGAVGVEAGGAITISGPTGNTGTGA